MASTVVGCVRPRERSRKWLSVGHCGIAQAATAEGKLAENLFTPLMELGACRTEVMRRCMS